MLRKLKLISIRNAVIALVISLIVTWVLTFVDSDSGIYYLLPKKDIHKVEKQEIMENAQFKIETNYLLDCIAESDYGRYYILPMPDDEMFMTVLVPDEYVDLADKINLATLEYIINGADEPEKFLEGRGIVKLADPVISEYMCEWFMDVNYYGEDATEAEIQSHISPYFLGVMSISDYMRGGDYVLLVVCILALLGSLAALAMAFAGFFQRDMKAYMNNCGLDEFYINDDYKNGRKFRSLIVGSEYSYIKNYMISNKDIIWVHQHTMTTKHMLYGVIKTGETVEQNVCIYGRDRKTYRARCKNVAEAKEIINYYERNYSHIILGYSEQLADIYNNDFAQFLALSYEKAKDAQQTSANNTTFD